MAAVGTGNHLNIGNNIGEASTWNPQVAIDNFTNILAQKKAQRDAERQQMVNQMGQLDPSKIRPQDQQDYYNKMQDWQNSAIAAQNTPQNSYQKMIAQGEAAQKLNALHSFIGESKQEGENERQLTQDWLKNPHMFSDDAHTQVLKSMNLPMSSADFIPSSQYGNLQRYVNPQEVNNALDTLHSKQLERTQYSDPIQSQGVDNLGNKTGVVVHNERSLQPTDILHNLLNAYSMGDNDKALVDRQYANIASPDGDPQKTLAMRIQQQALDRGDLTQAADGSLQTGAKWKQSTTPTFKPGIQAPQYSALEQYYMKHFGVPYNPNSTSQQSNAPTPLTTNYIEPARTGGVPDVQKWLNLAPTSQFRPGEKPTVSIDKNNIQTVSVPDQVSLDNKAVKANADAKTAYASSPEKQGGLLSKIGIGGSVVPYEKSDQYKTDLANGIYNPNVYKVVKPGYTENLDPNDPIGYHAKAGEISNELKIPVTAINNQAGGKGGRGVNPGIKQGAPIAKPAPQAATPTAPSSGNITFKTKDGKVFQIPFNKQRAFKEQFPDATIQ